MIELSFACTPKTLTKRLKTQDENNSRMIRVVWNESRKQHLTKQHLYVYLPSVSQTLYDE